MHALATLNSWQYLDINVSDNQRSGTLKCIGKFLGPGLNFKKMQYIQILKGTNNQDWSVIPFVRKPIKYWRIIFIKVHAQIYKYLCLQ